MIDIESLNESNDENAHTSTSSCNEETSTHNSQKSPDELNTATIKVQLTKKETQAVVRLRLIFLLIKLAVAAVVAFVIYHTTTQAETDEFESQYEGISEKILASFLMIVNNAGSIASVGKAATIYSLDNKNSSWPFHTISNYQERAATARLLSGSLFISMLHIVSDDDRVEWEKYVVGPARSWIEEGLEFNTDMGYDNFLVQNFSSFPNVSEISYINDSNEVKIDSDPGPYLARWTFSPAISSQMINQNLFRKNSTAQYVHASIEGKHAEFRSFEYGSPGSMQSEETETSFFATLRSIKEGKEVNYLGDPMARIYMPVYDTLHGNRSVVAVLASVVHWRSYFRSLLPTNVEGIDVVLGNTCGETSYTYKINGNESYLVGFGDLHDPSFNTYQKNASFENINNINDGTSDHMELAKDGCIYSVYVYPSSTYYDSIHTTQPVVLTVSMTLVIVFTIFMFLLYDRLVEKRQQIVLSKAAQSTAIVSSLFPKQVRDKMMEMQDEKSIADSKSRSSTIKLKAFMSTNETDISSVIEESQNAELFPCCTVFFADIAGFTAWSATREPANVFILLQTLFSGFDRIAKRRKVFKVETIGDCYLAVTGLPEPQINHYVIMARFAWECRNEMHHMMIELEKRLGPECRDLVLRLGLHSGPVTAGVLKGERARFQLFGDTVNTASRMESTGIRDQIQISQVTADLLMNAGKSHWIVPREDTIDAKGKGMMQTYWLSLDSLKKTISSCGTSDVEGGGHNSDYFTSDGVGGGNDSDYFTTDEASNKVQSKQDRLADWMAE